MNMPIEKDKRVKFGIFKQPWRSPDNGKPELWVGFEVKHPRKDNKGVVITGPGDYQIRIEWS